MSNHKDAIAALEVREKEAIAEMQRVIIGVPAGTHTLEQACAAVRARGQAGLELEISKTKATTAALHNGQVLVQEKLF